MSSPNFGRIAMLALQRDWNGGARLFRLTSRTKCEIPKLLKILGALRLVEDDTAVFLGYRFPRCLFWRCDLR